MVLFTRTFLYSQNLVPNNGFELKTSCPDYVGQFNKCQDWFIAGGTPDYYNSCGTGGVNIPNTAGGFQMPKCGEAFAGIIAYSPNSDPNQRTREYIEVELSSALIPGTLYYVQFYVNLMNACSSAIKGIGAYLTPSKIVQSTYDLINVIPQVEATSVISDKDGWTLISGSFTAVGGEKFIIIGNFKDDPMASLTNLGSFSAADAEYFIDEVSVQLTPPSNCCSLPKVTLEPSYTICSGENLIITATGAQSYSWVPAIGLSQTTGNSVSAIPAFSLTYTITGTDSVGCSSIVSTKVNVFSTPTVSVRSGMTISIGESINLIANGTGSFLWSPSLYLSCSTCANPIVKPEHSISYTITISDSNGCTNKEYIQIYVNDYCGEIFIPGAFSPNGDNQNDTLYVHGKCIESFLFLIYNRWGELVFESNTQKQGWDGTFNGKVLNTNIFTWLVSGVQNGKPLAQKGMITLIR